MAMLNTYTDDSFKARTQKKKKSLCHSAGAVVIHMLCPWLKAPNGGGEGAAVK